MATGCQPLNESPNAESTQPSRDPVDVAKQSYTSQVRPGAAIKLIAEAPFCRMRNEPE
jgi:hypothetical protein